MKNAIITRTVVVVIATLMSCSYTDVSKIGGINDLSPFAQKFLGLNSTTQLSLASSQGNVASQSFSSTMGYVIINGQAVTKDTTIVGPVFPDCGTSTMTTRSDGSTTYVIDYGSGCSVTYSDWQNTYWGKSTYYFKYSTSKIGSLLYSEYESKSIIDHMGGQNIYQGDTSVYSSNGHSTYAGSSWYDTTTQAYSSHYAFGDSSEYTYNKVAYDYLSTGSASYSGQRATRQYVSRYSNGDDYYDIEVEVPLVWDYSCPHNSLYYGPAVDFAAVSQPVSGVERVKYRQNGVEGTFVINYGDGTCDSLISITEDGKTIVIDMSQFFVPLAYQTLTN